jgi:putative nucleotidyltransferase with HDIG domain
VHGIDDIQLPKCPGGGALQLMASILINVHRLNDRIVAAGSKRTSVSVRRARRYPSKPLTSQVFEYSSCAEYCLQRPNTIMASHVTQSIDSPNSPNPVSFGITSTDVVPKRRPTAPLRVTSRLLRRLEEVNRELWLVFSLFALAGVLNSLVTSQRVVLGLYTLPTVVSAYLYGRRHATLTAFASVLMLVLLAWFNPELLGPQGSELIAGAKWIDMTIWGGTLMVTGYLMGTLCDHKTDQVRELRETYNGVMLILGHFISKDKYTENHSYRVSVYASRIAAALEFSAERIEDVRAAALLHDIGKLDVSRDVLYKAARLTEAEFAEMKTHVDRGIALLEPVGGSLRRVIPIILAHHDKFDGSGYHPTRGEEIPVEARIIAVADVYDALTSDRPYRKAMSPFEGREMIVRGSGTNFDPDVVDAFLTTFSRGEMELPSVSG